MIAGGFEPGLHILGTTAAILSTCLRALRSIVAGRLLSDTKLESRGLLKLMAPIAAVMLLPFALLFESTAFSRTQFLFGSRGKINGNNTMIVMHLASPALVPVQTL